MSKSVSSSSRDATYFVRGSNTLVPRFKLNGESDRVSDSVSAPGASDARLDGSEGLSVPGERDNDADRNTRDERTIRVSVRSIEVLEEAGTRRDAAKPRKGGYSRVSRLEASIDEFFPDVGQIMSLRSEKVNSLASCHLGIQVPLLGDPGKRRTRVSATFLFHIPVSKSHSPPDRDQTVGSDLSSSHTGNDRVGSVSLNIGEEFVVSLCRKETEKAGKKQVRNEPGEEESRALNTP